MRADFTNKTISATGLPFTLRVLRGHDVTDLRGFLISICINQRNVWLNPVIIQLLNFGITKAPNMDTHETSRELTLLEEIESDPNVNQSTLATQLGVAVGTVNWHLKRLIEKGYVKATRAERKKLRYIITPEGIALRARLAVNYVETSFSMYRKTRQRVKDHVASIRRAGHDRVRILGEGDVADIARLTCLEQGVQVTTDESAPALEIKGWKIILQMGDES